MGWGEGGGEFVSNSFQTIVSGLNRLFSDGCEDERAEGTQWVRGFGEEWATGRCAETRDSGAVVGRLFVLNEGVLAAGMEAGE